MRIVLIIVVSLESKNSSKQTICSVKLTIIAIHSIYLLDNSTTPALGLCVA